MGRKWCARVEWNETLRTHGNLHLFFACNVKVFIDLGTTVESYYVQDMTPADSEWYGVITGRIRSEISLMAALVNDPSQLESEPASEFEENRRRPLAVFTS
jgi:hypothetical protein